MNGTGIGLKCIAQKNLVSTAQWCIDLLDKLADGKSEVELLQLEKIFLNTTRYEYMFWDMAYNKEMWPTDE